MAAGDRVAAGLRSGTTLLAEPLKVIFDGMETEPLPTFAEAAHDIATANVLPRFQAAVEVVSVMAEDAQSPGGQHAGGPLTADGAAALLLWSNQTPPLYSDLTERCYNADRRQVRMYQKFLWLLVNSLKVLEPFTSTMVFRGVKLDLSADYPKDKVFTWHGPASCTKTLDVLENPQFCGTDGPRTQFIIQLTQLQARDITAYSFFKEDEVLLPPGCRFRVQSMLRMRDGLVQVQLLELPSPFWILNLAERDPPPARPFAAVSSTAAAPTSGLASPPGKELISQFESALYGGRGRAPNHDEAQRPLAHGCGPQ